MFGGKKKNISAFWFSEGFSRLLGGRGLHPDWELGVMLKWPQLPRSCTHWKPWGRCDQAPCAPGNCSVPPQLSSWSKSSAPCWGVSHRCAFLQVRTFCTWFGTHQAGWLGELYFLQMLWTNKKSKLWSQTPWPSLTQSPHYTHRVTQVLLLQITGLMRAYFQAILGSALGKQN